MIKPEFYAPNSLLGRFLLCTAFFLAASVMFGAPTVFTLNIPFVDKLPAIVITLFGGGMLTYFTYEAEKYG